MQNIFSNIIIDFIPRVTLSADVQKALPAAITANSVPSILLATRFYFGTVLFCYIHMYSAFRHPEGLCGLAHCGVGFDNIIGDADCPLFNIILQKSTP